LIETTLEWAMSIFVVDGDVTKAYDYTQHSCLIEGLKVKKVEDILIAAIIREIRRSKTAVVVDKATKTEGIKRTRSAPQGDPGMPAYFNAALDLPAGRFYNMAQKLKWGWRLQNGTYIAIILFADNFWLVARSAVQLRVMITEWLKLLREYGWDSPVAEMKWATTCTEAQFKGKIIIDGVEIPQAARDEGFRALGTYITFNGRNGCELSARIARAWQAFAKYANILCNREVGMEIRLKMLTILIHGALFWCSGSWNLTNDQLDNLRGLQQKMLRRMIARPRHRELSVEEYMISTNRAIKQLKRQYYVEEWDITAMRHHFGWAGYIYRTSVSDPTRISGLIMKYRDRTWLQTVEQENHGRQLHCRRLRIWRWERPLVNYAVSKNVGSWHELAADHRTWKDSLTDMAMHLRDNRA
jgi:hypothetical protein